MRAVGVALSVVCAVLLVSSAAWADHPAEELMVSTAASLTDAFAEIGRSFEKAHPGTKVLFNFAASGALASQIERGAPVDVFASAAQADMDRLQRGGFVVAKTRTDFAANSLVVVVPDDSTITIRSLADLRKPEVKRVAIGHPETVPAGRYAMQALKSLGVADAIRDKLVFANDVRQARTYAVQKEVDAALVYSTDAKAKGIKVACRVPRKAHGRIAYPAAVMAQSKHRDTAELFVKYLTGKQSRGILAKYGFELPKR
jgi:molybdate transport system substrate-binding protein